MDCGLLKFTAEKISSTFSCDCHNSLRDAPLCGLIDALLLCVDTPNTQ